MEVHYRHNLNSNYIVIKNQNIVVNDYRMNMLLNNDIEGFLNFCVSCIDGEIELSYLISSKQSIKDFFERQKLKYQDLYNIIMGIISIADKAHRYLLRIDDILLTSKFMYIDYNCKKVWFCYYPNSGNNFNEEIKKLIQEFILVTDHSDRKAVELIYGIYEICNKPDFLISDVELYISKYSTDIINKNDDEARYDSDEEDINKSEIEMMNLVCEKRGTLKEMTGDVYENEFFNFIKNNELIKKFSKIFKSSDK